MNKKINDIGDEAIQEWSRHYDSIVWTINSIFIPVIGGLLIYSYGQDTPAAAAPIVGLGLILFVLFYISGFRAFRHNLHSKIENPALRDFLRDPYQRRGLRQWDLYAVCMFAVTPAFVYRLFAAFKGPRIVYVGITILMGILIWYLWQRGTSESGSNTSKPNGTVSQS